MTKWVCFFGGLLSFWPLYVGSPIRRQTQMGCGLPGVYLPNAGYSEAL